MCFTSANGGSKLDKLPEPQIGYYNMKNRDRLKVNPRLFGLEIPDSVRNSLKSLAIRASEYFVFKYDQTKGPEIEDLLRARRGGWDHIIPQEDSVVTRYAVIKEPARKGQPLASSALPSVFTKSEWDLIERMAAESAKGSEARFNIDEAVALCLITLREP
jgi:hypothetical protein